MKLEACFNRGFPHIALAVLSGAAMVLGAVPARVDAQPPVCVRPIDPVQVPAPMGRPTEAFPTRDHLFVHSSTHLQGAPDDVKIAAGLIHRPGPGDALGDMTSALSVSNTSNTTATTVTVRFFDHLGQDMSSTVPFPPAACALQTITLQPEQTEILSAVPLDPATGCGGEGVGSARVTVAAGDPPIVGSVIHHTYCLFGGTTCDTDAIPRSSTRPPGATAMEQLQSIQQTSELWAGPMPFTASATEDIYNGMTPIVSVTNPGDSTIATRMDLVISVPTGGTTVVPFRPIVVIPPGGTWIESTGIPLNEIDALVNSQPPFPVGLWQQLLFALLAAPATDLDISIRVTSLGGEPILGNVLFPDVFADAAAGSLTLGKRFRMASTILQGAPAGFLMNPELSFEASPDPLIETFVTLANVGTDPTSVSIEYFDNMGVLIGAGNIPSLAPNAAIRIVPGTFGYPATGSGGTGPTGFGWMRIRACNPTDRLIGWSVREILDPASHPLYNDPDGHEDHFMKAYGEILMSTAAAEPGNGYSVTIGNTTRTRKLSPLIRVSGDWPGYSTAINDSVPNLFDYEWRIFNLAGFACGTAPFPGLPFGFGTWTYEDPETLAICVSSGTGTEGTAAIDVSTGTVDGIDVIGDPMREWLIPDFADGDPPPISGGGGSNETDPEAGLLP